MARAKHTYSVRLAVEGGGKVKAELVEVGQAGDRSLRKIETSSAKASRGLGGLTERARALGAGIRVLGGALSGIATVGGLAALANRSISAADAIGKTADKIGVGVEALQELRYAAQSAGIEQRTLDIALQRFTRRAAEAAEGTGEAKDALARMGIALKDQSGRIRATEDLLGDVAKAFRRIEDPAERVRLAFKLFDSEGVAMVNMLANGADRLEEMRRRARDLGIVLEEHLIRDAERARNELDTLGAVISANVTRAMLGLAPVIADVSAGLAELASDAGVAYEKLKLVAEGDLEFEGLSLRSTRATVDGLREEVTGLRAERDALGSDLLDDLQRPWLERRLAVKERALQQWQAKLAWLQRDAEKAKGPAAAPDPASTPDTLEEDIKAAEERARRLVRIEQDLQQQLFDATHDGADRLRAEQAKLADELRSLAAPDGSDAGRIEALIARSEAIRDARLARMADRERRTSVTRRDANARVIEGLRLEQEALAMTERQRFVSQAVQRLSAEATAEQRAEVEALASALYDERTAMESRDQAMERGRALTESLRTESERYADDLAELNRLLEAGAISQETYARALEQAQARMLQAGRDWGDGVRRALRDYAGEATDAARAAEDVTTIAFEGMEDALVRFVTTGKFEFSDLADSILADLARIAVRQAITAPLAQALGSVFGGDGLFASVFAGGASAGPGGLGGFGVSSGPAPFGTGGLYHRGGVVGKTPVPHVPVPPGAFADAPRLHGGAIAGMGLLPDEVPIIARRGELVVPPERVVRESGGRAIVVNMRVDARQADAAGFQRSAGQIARTLGRAIQREVR